MMKKKNAFLEFSREQGPLYFRKKYTKLNSMKRRPRKQGERPQNEKLSNPKKRPLVDKKAVGGGKERSKNLKARDLANLIKRFRFSPPTSREERVPIPKVSESDDAEDSESTMEVDKSPIIRRKSSGTVQGTGPRGRVGDSVEFSVLKTREKVDEVLTKTTREHDDDVELNELKRSVLNSSLSKSISEEEGLKPDVEAVRRKMEELFKESGIKDLDLLDDLSGSPSKPGAASEKNAQMPKLGIDNLKVSPPPPAAGRRRSPFDVDYGEEKKIRFEPVRFSVDDPPFSLDEFDLFKETGLEVESLGEDVKEKKKELISGGRGKNGRGDSGTTFPPLGKYLSVSGAEMRGGNSVGLVEDLIGGTIKDLFCEVIEERKVKPMFKFMVERNEFVVENCELGYSVCEVEEV